MNVNYNEDEIDDLLDTTIPGYKITVCDLKELIWAETFYISRFSYFKVHKLVLNQSFGDIILCTVSIYIIRDRFILLRGCHGQNLSTKS